MIVQLLKKRGSHGNLKCLILAAAFSSVFSSACADRVPVQTVQADEIKNRTEAGEDTETAVHAGTMEDWLSLGVSKAEEGNFKEAKDAFLEAVKINPDAAEAHYRLGHAYRELGDIRLSLRALMEAVRINPDLAEAYYSLGMTYRETGDEQGALQAFQEVIRITPENAVAHYSVGELYLDMRLKKEAKAAFIKAIEIKPEFAEAHYGLGSIYVMFNDIGSAFDEYKILIDLDRKLAYQLFHQIYE